MHDVLMFDVPMYRYWYNGGAFLRCSCVYILQLVATVVVAIVSLLVLVLVLVVSPTHVSSSYFLGSNTIMQILLVHYSFDLAPLILNADRDTPRLLLLAFGSCWDEDGEVLLSAHVSQEKVF
jgi:hypothetical protein